MANFSMDGNPVKRISQHSLTPINAVGEQIGATVYNKFSLELRYPITLKQSGINLCFRF
jgi:outer membrane protein insertion porin family